MIQVRILCEAEQELREAVSYYEERCPGLGLDLESAVRAAVDQIRHFPEQCSPQPDGTRRYLTRRFPYLIVYLLHDDLLWVLAVAHCSREPGYWISRLEG
ncbi:MAG: type II toxin-antitoxin system RelE/ParE family toxin [Kiritimatiellae bacterium]|nr:type II toxin-antitoxin system RelE/ParE family toxin [Kiritimatiellia bacterium]